MKYTLALALILTSCSAPKATRFVPHGHVSNGCRYTATWGGPTVAWIDHANGHQWSSTYKEFFTYCGQQHPNQSGIAVKGELPIDVH